MQKQHVLLSRPRRLNWRPGECRLGGLDHSAGMLERLLAAYQE